MKIRNQLALLVGAVVVPVALLAAASTVRLWGLQREAYEQRFLERVSALRLALDTQLEATVRLLEAPASSPDLDTAERRPAIAARLREILASHPSWDTIGVVDAEGRSLVVASRVGTLTSPPLPLVSVAPGAKAAFSDLQSAADGRFVTYVSVPVLRDAHNAGSLYAAISSDSWLEFLRQYPVSAKATLTINDRRAAIVARTLNNERWVGKLSSPKFWSQVEGRADGTFQVAGLEGQSFYTAFSRSHQSGWVLGTGVPSNDVEAALRNSTAAIIAGVSAAAISVVLFALWLGSRIIGAMTGLTRSAQRIAVPGAAGPEAPLQIEEAETVRLALHNASALLAARDAERSAAFAREAEARAEAERSNAAKDEFLAMLGHELRNPLSAMKSASALLAMPSVRPPLQERSREVIERQIGRLTDLVNDMLDVARLNSGKIVLERRPLDIADVARHVLASFHDSGRSLHVELTVRLEPARVFGDETRLEQIVANLLDNACKYTPPGGAVRIETGTAQETASLVVSDDGSGIAPDLLPRVFDVFSQGDRTLDRAQGGLGLGLTVVRRLVALHGGRVAAESAGAGRGATFRVELPAATEAELEGAGDTAPAPPLASQRIAVVEDNEDNRELMRLLLALSGHEVSAVGDGESGLREIIDADPDIAIVDIGLPGIDGFEVARRVRAAPGGERVMLLAVTGYGTPEHRETAFAAGFDGFLVKPFDLDSFDAIVGTVRGRRARPGAGAG